MTDDLLQIIEEQTDIIMQLTDRICKLARLLAEQYDVTQAEIESAIDSRESERKE